MYMEDINQSLYEQLQRYNSWRDERSRMIFSGDAEDRDHIEFVLDLMETTDDDILRIECRLFLEYNAVFLAKQYVER